MQYLKIGDIDVPKIGLGLYSMHGETLKNAVEAALASGYEWFDTAYRYENERELGEVLRGAGHEDSCISTKLSGLQYVGKRKLLYLDRLSAKRILRGSLKRLGARRVNMYMLHSPFRHYERAFAELQALKAAGLIGTIGVSGFKEEQLEQVKSYCGEYPEFNMIECHPYFSNKDLIAYCKSKDIKLIARSPLAHGVILPQLTMDNGLEEMRRKYGCAVPQLILRWIVQQNMVALVRSANPEHIKENVRVFDFELSDGDISYIDGLNINKSYGVK